MKIRYTSNEFNDNNKIYLEINQKTNFEYENFRRSFKISEMEFDELGCKRFIFPKFSVCLKCYSTNIKLIGWFKILLRVCDSKILIINHCIMFNKN